MAMNAQRIQLPFFFVALACLLLGGCDRDKGGRDASTSSNGQAAPGAGPGDVTINVAAAADLKFALPQLIDAFTAAHPGLRVTATFGSSALLFNQLSSKAPFDLFLSADLGYPRKLVEMGLAPRGSVFQYGRGQIVVWVVNESRLDVEKLGLEALLDPAVKSIAVANPDLAPYGRAAVAALKSRGVYDKVRDRLVFGENIAQTAQLVRGGSADVGIIARSLAVAPEMKSAGRFHVISPDEYPPIEQGGVILPWGQHAAEAKLFKDFIVSPASGAMLKASGIAPPEE